MIEEKMEEENEKNKEKRLESFSRGETLRGG